jgi:hypothetical protein
VARRIKVITATRNEDRLMYSRKFGVHGMISALVAVAILGICALVMDRGYLFSAPPGVVKVEKLTTVEQLDEVDVIAHK